MPDDKTLQAELQSPESSIPHDETIQPVPQMGTLHATFFAAASVNDATFLDYPNNRRTAVKLSARNVLAGTVTAVVRGQTTAHVKVDIGGGNTITASITVEAIDDLALKAGDKVSAIVKASDIIIGK